MWQGLADAVWLLAWSGVLCSGSDLWTAFTAHIYYLICSAETLPPTSLRVPKLRKDTRTLKHCHHPEATLSVASPRTKNLRGCRWGTGHTTWRIWMLVEGLSSRKLSCWVRFASLRTRCCLWAFGVLSTSEKRLGRIECTASRQWIKLWSWRCPAAPSVPPQVRALLGSPSPLSNLSLTHRREPHPGLRSLE